MLQRVLLRIRGYKHDFIKKSKELKKSKEIKAFFQLFFEILMFGGLALLAYLSWVSPNLLIKLLGFGAALWLLKEKIVPLATELLGSISLVKIYGR